MANVLKLGGGDRFGYLEIGCVPDSTFVTEINALKTAGTAVIGKLVSLTWAANYQVTSPANNAIPDGRIVNCEKRKATYLLTVRLWSYIDQNSVRHTAVCIMNLEYSGTLALQDSIICQDGNYRPVDDGGTGGWGAVIGLDTPVSNRADIIF